MMLNRLYKELELGELVIWGDERQMADGTWKQCEYWPGRRVEGGFFRREVAAAMPNVITIDDPLLQSTKTHVYYRLAEERDIGKNAWFTDWPKPQEYLLEHAPHGKGKLVDIKDHLFVSDILSPPTRFAYVREEIKLFEIIQVTKKQEFRLADEDHLGSNCYFTDDIVDPEEVREGWENDVVQGEYCERLVEINHNKMCIYKDSDGNHWRFAWVPVE